MHFLLSNFVGFCIPSVFFAVAFVGNTKMHSGLEDFLGDVHELNITLRNSRHQVKFFWTFSFVMFCKFQ